MIANVPFKSGQDETLDPKQAPPGTLTSLVNAYFAKPNEVRKRLGMLQLQPFQVDGATSFKAGRVFARGDALCAVELPSDGGRVFAHLETLARWRVTESAPEMMATWEIKVDSHASIANPGVAYLNGYVFLAWRTGYENSGIGTYGDVYISAYELEGGAVAIPPTRIAQNGRAVRIEACSTRVIVAWVQNTVSPWDIKAVEINSSTLDVSTETTMVAGVTFGTTAAYDLCWNSYSGKVYWAWDDGANISIAEGNQTLSIGATVSYGAPGASRDISICPLYNGERMAVGYYDIAGLTTRIGVWDVAGAAQLADAAFGFSTVAIARHPSDSQLVAVSAQQVMLIWNAYTGAAYSDPGGCEGFPVTRPWFSSTGRCYGAFMANRASVSASTGNPQSLVVAELPIRAAGSGGLPCLMAAHPAPRLFGDFSFMPTSVATVGTDDVLIASGTSVDYWSLTNTQLRQSFQVTRLKAGRGRCVTLPGGLSIHAAGSNWWFDGTAVADIGFVGLNPVGSETAGGGLANGQYLIAVVYERRDATGLLHRSEPYQTTVTVSVYGPTANVTILPYHVCVFSKSREMYTSNLHRSTWLALYCTDADGTLLYRVSKEPGFRAVINDTSLIGGPSAAATAHNGTFPNGPRALIYTTGGALPEVAPPGFTDLITHRGRLFGVSGDRKTIWFSKRFTDDDTVFPGFNELLTIRSEHPVVGLASHDTLLLIFTTRGIYFVDGDGPDATGVQGTYDNPRRMNADVEGYTADSIVSTSVGTFFQASDSKLYLVRGLEVIYIGRAIEDTLAAYPVTQAAFVLEKQRHVRFVCTDTGKTAGVVLSMDLDLKQWSKFTYGFVPVHGCVCNDKMVLVASGGNVWRESSAFYDEDRSGTKTWISMQLETAWMSFAEAAGAQFVRRINTVAERRSAHGMTMELAIDYASYAQTATFSESDVTTNLGRVNVHVGAQNGMSCRNRAIRVRLTDTAPATYGTGEGSRWSGLGVDVDPMKDLARQGANARKK